MTSQFKLIGFDLDGTLVNSLPDLALSVNSALSEVDLPPAPEELVLTWIGNGAGVLIGRALEWATARSGKTLSAVEIEQVKTRFNFYYGENLCNLSRLYPNVKETLTALKARGFILAVVTNKPTQHVLPVLKAFGIDHLFSETLGGNPYHKSNHTLRHCITYAVNSAYTQNKFYLWVIQEMTSLPPLPQAAQWWD